MRATRGHASYNRTHGDNQQLTNTDACAVATQTFLRRGNSLDGQLATLLFERGREVGRDKSDCIASCHTKRLKTHHMPPPKLFQGICILEAVCHHQGLSSCTYAHVAANPIRDPQSDPEGICVPNQEEWIRFESHVSIPGTADGSLHVARCSTLFLSMHDGDTIDVEACWCFDHLHAGHRERLATARVIAKQLSLVTVIKQPGNKGMEEHQSFDTRSASRRKHFRNKTMMVSSWKEREKNNHVRDKSIHVQAHGSECFDSSVFNRWCLFIQATGPAQQKFVAESKRPKKECTTRPKKKRAKRPRKECTQNVVSKVTLIKRPASMDNTQGRSATGPSPKSHDDLLGQI